MTRQALAVCGLVMLCGLLGSSMAQRGFAAAMVALNQFLIKAVQ